ncbi:MAG: acyl-CoA carboxylase subunit epsilon [Actinobacteria bacterium]|nr:MAG: acyl-CoA carboxylase subunit epsilon [Actinomycetota bacterium]
MSDAPLLRVVRGIPTAEEVAALVGALLLAGPAPAAPVAPLSRWARSARPSAGLRPGPGAWRASAQP